MPINCATTGNKIDDTLDQNVVRFAPKADIGSDITHARFVPMADIEDSIAAVPAPAIPAVCHPKCSRPDFEIVSRCD
jgi:hypothetical protein